MKGRNGLNRRCALNFLPKFSCSVPSAFLFFPSLPPASALPVRTEPRRSHSSVRRARWPNTPLTLRKSMHQPALNKSRNLLRMESSPVCHGQGRGKFNRHVGDSCTGARQNQHCRQCSSIEAAEPSDHLGTGITKTVCRSGASLNAMTTGEPGKPAPQLAGSMSGTKNIRCGRQCPSRSLKYPSLDSM